MRSLQFIATGMIFFALSCSSGSFRLEKNDSLKCDVDSWSIPVKEQGNKNCHCFHKQSHIVQSLGRNGSSAVQFSRKNQYAFTLHFKVEEGDYYEVSVWKKGNNDESCIIASAGPPNVFWRRSSALEEAYKWDEEVKDGWRKISMGIRVPPNLDDSTMSVFVWNPTNDSVLLDDFEIIRKNETHPEIDANAAPLRIQLSESKVQKLRKIRQRAFQKGVLEVEETDWVKGILFAEEDMNKINLRLKGDWLDHLIGKKWSFRIQTKSDYAWRGMRSFSIQNPSSRGFLAEWIAHKIFEQEDVLTTRYGFVPVELNGQSLGVYAYEEHFDKQLVEAKMRREGPLLKLSEDAFWKLMTHEKRREDNSMPYYQAAVIKPFKSKRTMSTVLMRNHFLLAQNLVFQQLNNHQPIAEIYDVDQLAKFYALSDLLNIHHGLAWHNQRFYYNPVTSKLEPVAFDCYGGGNIAYENEKVIKGNFYRGLARIEEETNLIYNAFRDAEFLKRYAFYLGKYSSEQFLLDFYPSIETELEKYESLIRLEFKSYKNQFEFLKERARMIRLDLPEFQSYVDSLATNNHMQQATKKHEYYMNAKEEFLAFYLNAYVRDTTKDSLLLDLANYYLLPLKVVGTGINNWYINEIIDDSEKGLTPFKNNRPGTQSLRVGKDTRYLFCLIEGNDQPVPISIYPWPKPTNFNPRQEIKEKYDVRNNQLFHCKDKEVRLAQQSIVLEEPVYIPPGFTFKLEQDETVDMKSASFMLIEGKVSFIGTKTNEISIRSSDKSAMGLIVLNASGESELAYVRFEQLTALSYKGWVQTGAVNFYESDVQISHCVFSDNSCEDGLNIIRSQFDITNTTFNNTYADAFDSDFSIGMIKDAVFTNIGNDAIDLSGSNVEVKNCKIATTGDKGISAGEKSHANVSKVFLNDVNIGFASKDESKLIVNDATINNAKFGIVVFQKKPEFDPAQATIDNLFVKDVKNKFLIEKGSVLFNDGKKIKGERLNVGDLFYDN